eukprot:scaffold194556_cov28-Tisochrysis_lutea.AAC.1
MGHAMLSCGCGVWRACVQSGRAFAQSRTEGLNRWTPSYDCTTRRAEQTGEARLAGQVEPPLRHGSRSPPKLTSGSQVRERLLRRLTRGGLPSGLRGEPSANGLWHHEGRTTKFAALHLGCVGATMR